MSKPKRINETTPSISEDQLAALRTLIPQAFTEGQVDFEKLRASLGDLVDDRPERYSFSWAGKRDAIRLLQAPSRATLMPARDESLGFDTTQNIFIEGDNLEVLKLLYKPYFGRVKMIYIDPPYNTGNDFVYPDNFADPLDIYLQLTGQKDSTGNLLTSNPETGGRYHSAWLSMMYPRLFLARQLLREDGVIFVSIDDHEVHNLRLLMNEIFGEENFVGQITVLTNPKGRVLSEHLAQTHDYVLAYAKASSFLDLSVSKTEEQINIEYPETDEGGRFRLLELRNTHRAFGRFNRKNLFYPLYIDPKTGHVTLSSAKGLIEVAPTWDDGFEGCWTWDTKKVHKDNYLLIGKIVNEKWKVFRKSYAITPEGEVARKKSKTIWDDKGFQTEKGQSQFDELIPGRIFQSPKPADLIKAMLQLSTDADDMVLDFFAGSCTTAQAVLALNREDGGDRRFIMVQLPEPTSNQQFPTIAEIGKERIRRVVERMKKEREGQLALDKPEDLGFKVFKLAPSNYRQWDGAQPDAAAYARQAELFADPLVEGWQLENVLYEVALKEGYGLNIEVVSIPTPDVAAVHELPLHRVTDPDKGQSLYLTLAAKIALQDLRPLDLKKDDLFICRDAALDDEAAANLALQCRLKTI